MAKIDVEIKGKFENNKHRFIANLVFTSNWFRNLVGEHLKPYNISFQQLNILRILRGAEDWMSMNDLKDLMIEKSPNATRLADKLIVKGFVERKRSEADRRVVYLSITDKGVELLETINNISGNYMEFTSRITEEEAKLVSDILDKVRG
ncbi:MAG: MarR family transcriptional regulator [Chitinophagales bacterium]|nr:MarR family transcriptional regulator [Chitinophagales bacterium]